MIWFWGLLNVPGIKSEEKEPAGPPARAKPRDQEKQKSRQSLLEFFWHEQHENNKHAYVQVCGKADHQLLTRG